LSADGAASIIVIAGTNGAGKSSIAGEAFRASDSFYFNPDEETRRILSNRPGTTLDEANSRAWKLGKRLLENAIRRRTHYTFETTLGGNTITSLLQEAALAGLAVRMWYVGLNGPELHIARVRARVAAGGHDIPEMKIRQRFDDSRNNLIRLLPVLTELQLFDNSAEGDPERGEKPLPQLLLSMIDGTITEHCPVADVPRWAKPIVMAAFRTYSI